MNNVKAVVRLTSLEGGWNETWNDHLTHFSFSFTHPAREADVCRPKIDRASRECLCDFTPENVCDSVILL